MSQKTLPLSGVKVGEQVTVARLGATGSMRRRLLDIGLIEGTRVECLQRSPSGDPAAYAIRGAVIALRDCDSASVSVTPIS